MPLTKWYTLDIYNSRQSEADIMDSSSLNNRFSEISQSHANTLLRNKR